MAAMTSWSMSWRLCSTADGEVCGDGGEKPSGQFLSLIVMSH
jgi:hypothetical protein